MIELTDRHKELLRSLVKLRRDGTIPEEFAVWYFLTGPLIRSADDWVKVDGLSRLGLESLSRAGCIFSLANHGLGSNVEDSRSCYITPAGFRAVDTDFAPVDDILMRRPPVEITRSLADFREDWPDPSRLAFIMMQFSSTKAHNQIHTAIRHALDPHQFVTLRADDKQYHDDTLWNILTYMYGCRFGIAVFERIEVDAFNPNVSLEVGYMMGLGKPVCYLKERTLPALHTDLVGRLYQTFDLQSCEETIPQALWKWMSDKGLMVQRVERNADDATG